MPEWGTPEFERIAKRAAQLSLPQLIELVIDVGRVAFGNKQTVLRTATKGELIDLLDEVESRAAVLEYLKQQGV